MFYFQSVFSFDANIASSKKQFDLIDKLEDFSENEDGIATVWAIFWLILCFSISGLAIDVTNAWKVHTILQSTADSAALAGAYELRGDGDSNTTIDAGVKAYAIKFAEKNMYTAKYGDVLLPTDVQLGYWINDTDFIPMLNPSDNDATAADAVRVVTRQSGTAATSAVGTFFLRFVGFNRFTVATSATVKVFQSQCAYDGLIAQGKVILSTKQRFLGEYCVHGEEGIDLANDNYFGPDTIASTREEDTCGQSDPKCTESSNPGIEDAYMEQTLFGTYVDADGDPITDENGDPILYGKVAKISDYYDSIAGNTGEYAAAQAGVDLDNDGFIGDGETINTITVAQNTPLNVLDLKEGMVNIITCPPTGGPNSSFNVKLELDAAYMNDPAYPNYPADGILDLNGIAIVGDDCDFTFDSTVKYANATIATNATGTKTFQGGAGTVLGIDDNTGTFGDPTWSCTRGNEVTLITMGSVHFAAKLEAYDLEIIAAKDVLLAARVDDSIHVGTSVTAGGDIHVTTSHDFLACDGMTSSVFDPILSYALVQ